MARPTVYGDLGGNSNRRSNRTNNPVAVPGTTEWYTNQMDPKWWQNEPTDTTTNPPTFPWEDNPTAPPVYENNPMDTGVIGTPVYTKPSGGGGGFTTDANRQQLIDALVESGLGTAGDAAQYNTQELQQWVVSGVRPGATAGGGDTGGGDTGGGDTGGGDTGGGGTENPTGGDLLFGDWQTNANNSYDPQSILDFIQNLPSAQRNAELYAPLVKELQDLIASKGQSGVISVDKQFEAVKGDIQEASDEQYRRTMGNLARSGTLESGGLREARIRENIAFNKDLATARVAIETANSQQAAEKYGQALTQMQQLQEQAAKGEIDWFNAAMQMNALGAENQRAWAQMGLSEKLTVMGYDVEKYKTDQANALGRERLRLEEMLGLKDINLRELMETNNFNLEKTKMDLQKWMTEGGWKQEDAKMALDRWAETLRAQVQNKRTDVDMINAMTNMSQSEWQKQIAQADMELRRYLGEEEYNLRKQELGQDWDKFVQSQATTKWMASNQWEVDKYIAKLGADANKGGWGDLLGSLISAGGTIGAAAIMASSIDFKKDVSELTGSEQAAIRKQLLSMKVYDYRYKGEPDDRKKHIGILVEESPDALVTDDGKHISLGDAFGMMLVTIKCLEAEVRELRKRNAH